jgi:hypothetical protein
MLLSLFVSAFLLAGCHSELKLSAEDRFHRLTAAFRKEYREFRQRCHDASAGQKLADAFSRDPRPVYCDRVLALAGEFPTDPVAEEAVVWVFRNAASSDTKDLSAAAKIASQRYLKSSKMVEIIPVLRFCEDANSLDLLRSLSKSSPHARVRTFASLMYAEKITDKDPEQARSLLKAILKEKEKGLLPARIETVAASDLFDLEHLAIGMAAPVMAGEDSEGRKIALSDFKGKVVLISFFGDW